MNFAWVKTPWFIRKIFYKYTWKVTTNEKIVYLTFDDGPIPEVTPWVLQTLNQFNVKATFFCVGENISKHPEIFKELLSNGHQIGNHTYNHLKGWNTNTSFYIDNTYKCQNEIEKYHNTNTQKLFRPPYGKIKFSQSKPIIKDGFKMIMWDILSRDYDVTISEEECLNNVIKNTQPGSIIVFHDNIKAFRNLQYALPKTIEFLKKEGYVFKTL